jgi:D-serine dehydratase
MCSSCINSSYETLAPFSSKEHGATSSLRREARTISEAVRDLDRLSTVVARVLPQSAAEAWGEIHSHAVRVNTRLAA